MLRLAMSVVASASILSTRKGHLMFAIYAVVCLILAASLRAQDMAGMEQGLKPYGSFEGGNIDSISMVNLKPNLRIPLIEFPQRGDLHFGFYVTYQNPIYEAQVVNCLQVKPFTCTFQYFMYRTPQVQIVSDIQEIGGTLGCGSGCTQQMVWDPDLTAHQLGQVSSTTWVSLDATGYSYNTTTQVLTDRRGIRQIFPGNNTGSIEDTNGNKITYSNGLWTDTMGRAIPVPPPTGPPTNPPGWSGPTQSTPGWTSDFSGCGTGSRPINAAVNWTLPGYNGGNTVFKVCYASYNIVAFTSCGTNCTGINTTNEVIQSIVLPNQTTWIFNYDNNSYGDLTQIVFPTGGSITYASTTNGNCVPPDNTHGVPSYAIALTSRTLNSNDGTGSHITTYSQQFSSPTLTTTSTDPLGNQTVHTLSGLGGGTFGTCSYYETQTQFYQGTASPGNLLKTVSATYSFSSDPYSTNTVMNVVPTTVVTSYPNGEQNQVLRTYDSGVSGTGPGLVPFTSIYGNVLTEKDYDFGSGGSGPLLRTTTNTYQFQVSSPYLNNNLLDLLATVKIQDGSGNQAALTQYNYDETPRASSGLTSSYQFDSAPPAGSFRGNNTSIYRWLNSGTASCPNGHSGGSGGYLISPRTYFDDGMLNTSSNPCGDSITYAYSLIYWGALPTAVTNALGQSTTYAYDFNTSLFTSKTDANNQPTTYTYDSMWRTYQVAYPDGGQDTITYQESSLPFSATVTSKMNATQNKVRTNIFDGLGRISQTQLTSVTPNIVTLTTYDALGRKSTVYNPTRCSVVTTNCGESTWGYSTPNYDALNRVTSVTQADGSVVSTNYSGFPCATVTDAAGKSRKSCNDALGRLTQVFEDPSGANYETDYQYDVLGDLLRVDQKGGDPNSANWRTRLFTYDSLSRLISAFNPESGTISYSYDPNGNVTSKTAPMPNQPNSSVTVTTTYQYDPLNRVIQKSYSDGTPTATFYYDTAPSAWATGEQNTTGRLVEATTGHTPEP